MRQIKTITNVINFIPRCGEDFYNDFFGEDGKIKAESAIESVYCNNIILATTGSVDVIKEKMFTRGISDGVIRFKFGSNIIEFNGIQECKRKLNRNQIGYPRQILQALLYAIQMKDCRVLIINSENYFDYIILDENKDFILEKKDQLLNILEQRSPSSGYEVCDFINELRNLVIHTNDVPKKSQIDKIMLDIYRRCY